MYKGRGRTIMSCARCLMLVTFILLIQHGTICHSLNPSATVSNDIISTVELSSDVFTSPTPPTDEETTRSPIEEHLSLIIGVPTGIGLCILMFLGCFIYCGVSSLYHSWKEKRLNSTAVSGAGTRTTGVPRTLPQSSTADYDSSTYHASYFEPSEDTLPRRHNKEKSNQDSTAEATSAF